MLKINFADSIHRILSKLVSKYFMPIFLTSWYVHGAVERLHVGKRVSLANTLFNTRSGSITVGDRVIFGHNVMVLTGMHDMTPRKDDKRRETITDAGRDIVIDSDAWIGSGVIILGPVKIGKNAVVASGSVVSKDIPDRVLAQGNPARIIRII